MNIPEEKKQGSGENDHEAVKSGKDAISAAREVDRSKSEEEKDEEERADAEKWRNEG